MLDELNPNEGGNALDNLNELDSLSDDVVSHVEEIDPMIVDPIEVDSVISEDPSGEPGIDISELKPEVSNGLSFKGGACVCSCDMSCTVGY